MREKMYQHFNEVEEHHWWFQARKNIVLKMIDKYFPSPSIKKNSLGRVQILDVGCGTGMMLKHLAQYGEVWGLDKDERAISFSRKKIPRAHYLTGSFPNTIPNQQFDLITALDVLEHIEDDIHALAELATILKPGGIMLITAPAHPRLWTHHDDLNEHIRRYTKKELREKLLNTGLEIQKLSYYNMLLFAPIVLVKLALGRYAKGQGHLGGTPPHPVINIPLKKIFSSEQYILPCANLPFGVSLIAVVKK